MLGERLEVFQDVASGPSHYQPPPPGGRATRSKNRWMSRIFQQGGTLRSQDVSLASAELLEC